MTAGNYDPTFNVRISRGEGLSGEAAAEVPSVYVDALNRVWITGKFTHVNGVGRLDADGALDTNFNPAVEYVPFTSRVSGLAADADGTLYLWVGCRHRGIAAGHSANSMVGHLPGFFCRWFSDRYCR